jgi:small subunit ribosomal protein S15
LDKTIKKAVIAEYAVKEGDTGSTEVQVAVLTTRIKQLAEHMKANKHDQTTRRSLMRLIGQRKRLLTYLTREDVERYRNLIARLGLRK